MPQRFAIPESLAGGAVRKRILAFGDSLTAGYNNNGLNFEPYGASLAEGLMPEVAAEVFVNGLSGKTAQEMASNLDGSSIRDMAGRQGQGLRSILQEFQPIDLVLIMAGTNDLRSGSNGATIAANIQALHEACHKKGVRTVALSTPPNSATLSQDHEILNSKVKEMCTEFRECVLSVDTSTLVPYGSSGNWDFDGLHYTPSGSQMFGKALAPLIQPFLK